MGSRIWLWPNVLSLDAPLIALLWQVLFVRCFHSRPAPLSPVLLVVSVWLIYAADHALDAFLQVNASADRPRHRFYRRYWRVLAPLWSLALSLCAWMAWTRLPAGEFDCGAALLFGVAIYFAAVHAVPGALERPGSKEAAVALLFGLGTALAAWPHVSTVSDALAIVLFAVLCWVNCTAIEDWENGRGARKCTGWAAGAIAVLAVVLLREHRPVLGSAETASAMGLLCIDRMRGRLSPDALRVLADAVLATPLLFLPAAGLPI